MSASPTLPPIKYFNPRTREGCDTIQDILNTKITDFNPRTREGCDLLFLTSTGITLSISIHAPARGATIRL